MPCWIVPDVRVGNCRIWARCPRKTAGLPGPVHAFVDWLDKTMSLCVELTFPQNGIAGCLEMVGIHRMTGDWKA